MSCGGVGFLLDVFREIGITGTATTARKSAEIANAIADAVTVSGNEAAKNTGVRLVLFSQALAPASRISNRSQSSRISVWIGVAVPSST